MLDENLSIPLYQQLKMILQKRIGSGEWGVDCQLPTEQMLCNEFAVSRITVRKALDALEQEGYIYKRRGKGTYVRSRGLHQRLSTIYSFSEEIRKSGRVSSNRILKFTTAPCDDTAAGRLHLTPGTPVVCIHRLRLVDNEPFALETSFLPHRVCIGLTEDSVAINGLYASLELLDGPTADIVEESFEAVIIPAGAQALLKVGRYAPGLRLERVASQAGRPFEYCQSLIRGDRYQYSVLLRRHPLR